MKLFSVFRVVMPTFLALVLGCSSSSSSRGEAGTGTMDTDAEDTRIGDSGAGDSGTGDSGAGDSGVGDFGTGDSGMGDSGVGDSGMGDSGVGDSGAETSGLSNDTATDCDEKGATKDAACGLNGRGVKRQTCEDGIWISMQCLDVDFCVDGDSYEDTCGVMGTFAVTCVLGRWANGACSDQYTTPTGDIPSQSKGQYLYFTAKKIDEKYNSDLYRLNLTGATPIIEQLTTTTEIDEISPAIPPDLSFVVYADGYYEDPSISELRWAKLDSEGVPVAASDKVLLERVVEPCEFMEEYNIYLGQNNPAVTLDGSEIVFIDTYATYNYDPVGCPQLGYQLARATLDATGNLGAKQVLPSPFPYADEGPMRNRPMTPVYLYDTKRVIYSIFGLDQHPQSTEIAICTEDCADAADWDFLTYAAIWSTGSVAQRSATPSAVSDEIAFYRLTGLEGFQTGIYTAADIATAAPDLTYGAYGVLATEELFVSGFAGENLAASHRPLAYSPDGKLLAAAVTFVDNFVGDKRHSTLAILGKATGEIYAVFDFKLGLREIDGLVWR